jgi:hypothetical protein
MGARLTFVAVTLLATTLIGSAAVPPEADSVSARLSELWVSPDDLETRDLFAGPWGAALAPDPDAVYTFVAPKKDGINPGMTVRDPRGREWKVKQPPTTGRGAEGPIEVVLSRVLAGVGYHQPPIYYLPSFLLEQDGRQRRAPGGRFRLTHFSLRDLGEWEWMKNPFTETTPYRGLLVILLMFNSSDLKDSNNTLYEHQTASGAIERWYVVRDLGTALGSTARVTPIRGNPAVFERLGFIKGLRGPFVEFEYQGLHGELFDRRITPDHVRWASELMAQLTDEQWHDAFRAGGYQPAVAERFITRLHAKIADGLALGRLITERH